MCGTGRIKYLPLLMVTLSPMLVHGASCGEVKEWLGPRCRQDLDKFSHPFTLSLDPIQCQGTETRRMYPSSIKANSSPQMACQGTSTVGARGSMLAVV